MNPSGLTNLDESSICLCDKQKHTKVTFIDDRQQPDCRVRYGNARSACLGTKAERDYTGGALISFSNNPAILLRIPVSFYVALKRERLYHKKRFTTQSYVR
jgi:hypothetical protein